MEIDEENSATHQIIELIKESPGFESMEELGPPPTTHIGVCGRSLTISVNPWLREALLTEPEADKVTEFDLWFQKVLIGNGSGFNRL